MERASCSESAFVRLASSLDARDSLDGGGGEDDGGGGGDGGGGDGVCGGDGGGRRRKARVQLKFRNETNSMTSFAKHQLPLGVNLGILKKECACPEV